MKSSKLYHGACYYPELWKASSVDADIREMKQLGINLVRMGEFAWSIFEPIENEFDFSFHKMVMQKLYENEIGIILCTPTPTPPVWMTHGHSERCHKDINGVMSHGSRLHICTNNAYFRTRAAMITEKMAAALGSLPGVVLWQLDNEFKSHVSYCLCETCHEEWQTWLEERYKTIAELNEAWGTAIFSETYQSFAQVPQPMKTPFLHNASLQTMYRKFSMDKIAEFAWEQAEILRRYSSAPVTTNGSINFDYDFSQLFSRLDAAAFDTYASSQYYSICIMNHDFWRNVKRGRKHWLVETSCTHGGNIQGNSSPHPVGYLAAEAVAAYALDAQSFCYWLWRQQRTGCEINHSAILSAWGKPSVGYSEVEKVSAAIREIAEVILHTTLKQPEIALAYSDIARTFFETEKLEVGNYTGIIRGLHKHIFDLGLARDVITETAPLGRYKLLWTAFMPYVSEAYLQKARRFVENGGYWIVGPMTGHRTGEHSVPTDYGLGSLEKTFGFETKFIYPLGGTNTTGRAFGKTAPLGGAQSAVFAYARGWEARGSMEGGITPGEAFIIEREFGKGRVILLGAFPMGDEGGEMLRAMVSHYAGILGIRNPLRATAGTEVVCRTDSKNEYYIVINMDGQGGTIQISEHEIVSIDRYSYSIIKSKSAGDGYLKRSGAGWNK